ncbi:hypothetical protein IIA15_06695, partial [candidate division TA06 bacterium]|nr:hypothetical protein [candidate division TA06 bacterium]
MTTSFNFDIFLSLKIVKKRRESLVWKIVGIPLVLLSLLQISEASPTLHNPRGLFRVLSAEIHEEGSLLIVLEGENFKYGPPPEINPNIRFSFPPSYWISKWAGQLDVTYTPFHSIELYGAGKRMRNRDWLSNGVLQNGFGDTEVGLKVGRSATKAFKFGAMGYGILPTGEETWGVSNGSSQWGGRGLVTVDLTQVEGVAPLRFHGNVGYNINRSKLKKDAFLFGLGMELSSNPFTPFIEFTTEQSSDHSFFENPVRFTSGIRFTSPFGPIFDFGYDVNLSKEVPNFLYSNTKIEPHDWSLLLGIQFETSLHL